MNKPYFTKYIPVPGEIKEGDVVSVSDDQGNDKFFTYKKTETGKDFSVKYKLFLCSRDIQVGDEMIIDRPDRPSIHGTKTICRNIVPNPMIACDMLMLPRDHKMDHLSTGEAYKVIGEVSPAAIWIKPDMEFEKDQLEQDDYGNIYRHNKELTFRTTSHWMLVEPFIKFKCPTCNTFH